jgi:uncharacterized repeat protein (TIGR03803 family)
MKIKRLLIQKLFYPLGTMLALAMLAGGPAANAQGNAYEVIHDFTGANGGYPWYSLIFDAAGNLYGITAEGGTHPNCGQFGCGAIFKLSSTSGGVWNSTVLYEFSGGTGGWTPAGGLVLDEAGNLYGTTLHGGGVEASGVVYKLSRTATGQWTETVLHTFSGADDGGSPSGKLIFDSAGNLYGTTASGGALGYGTVFELSPSSSGWTETQLYNFSGGSDGGSPQWGVTFDAAGNLYGSTSSGGYAGSSLCASNQGCGVVFELTPRESGRWSEKILNTFTGGNGRGSGPLVFDDSGNIYGTTGNGGEGCGTDGCGVVYELSPVAGGWNETVLFRFPGGGTGGWGGFGGSTPLGVILGSDGSLYGTAFYGGNYESDCSLGFLGCGVVYRLSRSATGTWGQTVLRSFTGGADGGNPQSGLTFGPNGNLFSSGVSGPASSTCITLGGCGVVFEIAP